MFFLLSVWVALVAGGSTTVACKGGPDVYADGGTDGGLMGSLGKSAASEDCASKGDDSDGGCPEDEDGGN
jgi:hypothetical protein